MITTIENLEHLSERKKALQIEVDEAKINLMHEFYALEQSLTPMNLVISGAKKIFTPSDSLAGNLITNSISTFASKTLFGGVSWPLRWVLKKATSNIASHLLEDNKGFLIGKVAALFAKKPNNEVTLLDRKAN